MTATTPNRIYTPLGFFDPGFLAKAITFYERHHRSAPPLLDEPPVEWERAADAMSLEERQELGEVLDGFLERAARLRGYLDARCIGGTDQGHDKAVKESNRLARIVRKALGYYYPSYIGF
jgi:hypothetical protein